MQERSLTAVRLLQGHPREATGPGWLGVSVRNELFQHINVNRLCRRGPCFRCIRPICSAVHSGLGLVAFEVLCEGIPHHLTLGPILHVDERHQLLVEALRQTE